MGPAVGLAFVWLSAEQAPVGLALTGGYELPAGLALEGRATALPATTGSTGVASSGTEILRGALELGGRYRLGEDKGLGLEIPVYAGAWLGIGPEPGYDPVPDSKTYLHPGLSPGLALSWRISRLEITAEGSLLLLWDYAAAGRLSLGAGLRF